MDPDFAKAASLQFLRQYRLPLIFVAVALVLWLAVDGPARLFAADIPTLRARVTGLSFFEDGRNPGPTRSRRYHTEFPARSARYIYWEISLKHPASAVPRSFALREVWAHKGVIVHRREHRFVLQPGFSTSHWYAGTNFRVAQTMTVPSPHYDAPLGQSGSEMLRCRDLMGEWGPCPSYGQATRSVIRPGAYDVVLYIDGFRAAEGRVHLLD